jgi:hypothetical protein
MTMAFMNAPKEEKRKFHSCMVWQTGLQHLMKSRKHRLQQIPKRARCKPELMLSRITCLGTKHNKQHS